MVILSVVFLLVAVVAALGVAYIGTSSSRVNDNVPVDALPGQCFGNDGSKRPVDCDQTHYYEVLTLLEYPPDMDYPSRFIRATGNLLCEEDLEAVTGEGYILGSYDYHEVYPSEEEWNRGNHVTTCVLFHGEFKPIDTHIVGDGPIG